MQTSTMLLSRSKPDWAKMQSAFELPIGKENDFKGVIDLFEMKAYIYNDDKGEDITIEDDSG